MFEQQVTLKLEELVALSLGLESKIREFETNLKFSESIGSDLVTYWEDKVELYKSLNTKLGF